MLTRLFLVLPLLLTIQIVNAGSNFKLSIAQWAFNDIQSKNLQIDVDLKDKGLTLTATADSIKLAEPIGKLTKIKLYCDEVIFFAGKVSCQKGKVSFQQHQLGYQTVFFNVTAQPDEQKYQIKLSGLKLASAKFSATIYLNKSYWRVVVSTARIQISQLIKASQPYLQAQQREVLKNWQAEGNIKISGDITGQNAIINTLKLDGELTSLNLTDKDSRYVSENVVTKIQLKAKNGSSQWQWNTSIRLDKGQAYGEPVYIDFDATPMNLVAQGFWQQDTGEIEVSQAKIKQKGIMQVTGNFKGGLDRVEKISLTVAKTKAAAIYEHWLQPFVLGTAVDSLKLKGQLAFNYQQNSDKYFLSLDLKDLNIEDIQNRFSMDNINGKLGWTNYQHKMDSELQWQKAIIYAIPLGRSHFQAQTVSSELTLSREWDIPIFDGDLKINKLSLQRPGEASSKWNFEGQLTPISMEQVSSSLGWPILHGKLSGVIPKVSYSNKHIDVDGALTVNLFEGTTVITHLQLDQPFGPLPQLYADVDMKDMNLSTLTKTFDFGDITGRLDGQIKGLRLSNWRPVQFDARFFTPKGDKSRHRISQRAINNLSKVGGGVGGALQRSFLRFFKDFSYKRLGLSCKLRNEVCQMAGAGKAKNGYYIVKGGGFPPRINVVGYTRQVDWPELINRLKSVSESSGSVVIE